MEGSAAARGEGSADEKRESPPPDESSPALHTTIMAEKPGDNESPENKGRAPLPKIMAARSGEPEPSLEEKVRQIRVTMSARAETISVLEIGATTRAETISVLGIGAPTTPVEPPQGAGKAPAESEAPNTINLDEGDENGLGDALDQMLEREITQPISPQTPQNGDEEVDYDSDDAVTSASTITGGDNEESGAPLSEDYGQQGQNDPEAKGFEGFNEDNSMEGNDQECISQPVLTQQIIMDLIVNQPQPIMQPPNYAQGGWEEKKLGYSRLLEGYKSPTGSTIRATLDLGSLMFAAVAAESVNRISLMAQQDANEKLVKQAEQHRELMEKEFTATLARIREEHQKTIDETIRIRDECAQMYAKTKDVNEDYLQKVDEHQGGELVKMQLEFMRKRAERYAQEVRDNAERHEQELAQEKALTASKDKDLARERSKIKELQAEIREFEESLLGLKSTKIRGDTVEDKGEAPAKKIKMEIEGAIRAVAVPANIVPAVIIPQATVAKNAEEKARKDASKVIVEVASKEVRTSAYTTSDRHKKALDTVTKKETAIKLPQEQSSSQDDYAATPQQITQAFRLWKDRLIKSGDYVPHQQRSHKAHVEKIKILRGAMADFKASIPVNKPSEALMFTHARFGPLQREYHIPLFYCEPEKFFKEVARESNILYNKRVCSLWDFYDYLSKDTPGYNGGRKDKRSPNQEAPIRTSNIAINPFPRDNGKTAVDNWLQVASPSARPVVETTIPASAKTTTSRYDITAREEDENPVKLTILQKQVVDKVVQSKEKIRVPIPSEGDSTDHDDDLFDDKLLPAEKLRLKTLETDIKRIKQQNYTPKYLKDKEKAISNAEKDRLCGMVGPDYLNGVSYPWNPGAGQAPMQYDYYKIGRIEKKIAKLRKINTAHVQLEYIANEPKGKGGPGGQGKR